MVDLHPHTEYKKCKETKHPQKRQKCSGPDPAMLCVKRMTLYVKTKIGKK
jgi:hypothetical protein